MAGALPGAAAERMVEATSEASWRIFNSGYVLDETERVMAGRLGLSRRFAHLTRRRARRRATLVQPTHSRHRVPADPDDSPIHLAALAASVDYLLTNDPDVLELSPYEGVRIVSMTDYHGVLQGHGLLA